MTILFDKNENGIARITLNRPEVHNAFNDEMISDLYDAFKKLQNDDDCKVVVLSGNGVSFSAGADLNWMKKAADYSYGENLDDANRLSDMLNALYHLPQLTVTCTKGANMGGALGLISCSDIVVADESSRFSFSEVKLGLVPATISPFVIKAIGERQAKRYFQTAENFGVEKAKEIGLVHEITTSEDALDGFLETLFYNIKNNAPMAMRSAKDLVSQIGGREITDGLRENTAEQIAKTRVSSEAREGLTAFFDKRKPDWKNNV
ncbi:enoyl-CoA hydratase/isomerase family protein [Pseudemcibacter aquimaris]|uniref:enoyl-CoA hydratase/isomerase family protein n=1 Tax=Pseudemcibacter aquimaris TaxID=2857064 RepID=UPI0020116B62|nr:enoyl-CoA hydratase/isomerase family protein [Pseudemcibacter aquimaris]MCC3860294.1 enoyl-CoA hydratase/isomerase family protein [Pseudemcibacter aquimaris]WDU57618.1 enoyl-CoA hydratase/isomerase family protein [Pseudemcibacter aquimaris]